MERPERCSIDIIDTPIVTVDMDTPVEEACEVGERPNEALRSRLSAQQKLLAEDITCLAITASPTPQDTPNTSVYFGLFDVGHSNPSA